MFKIGFSAEAEGKPVYEVVSCENTVTPRRSVVQVRFDSRGLTLSYYNDTFDIRCGDFVYVEGKLEGILGRVVEVNYNFKIKLSDYKRVIYVVDTEVKGSFYMAGSHFVTFDRKALPFEKVIRWFKPPLKDDEELVIGNDDTSFSLGELSEMKIASDIAERGVEYYKENRVSYISIDGVKGYAIVEGSEPYDIEFELRGGEISHLVCSCWCSNNCKHMLAAMLQLKETLEIIKNRYSDKYDSTVYFSAVRKSTLFEFAVDGKERGSFTL